MQNSVSVLLISADKYGVFLLQLYLYVHPIIRCDKTMHPGIRQKRIIITVFAIVREMIQNHFRIGVHNADLCIQPGILLQLPYQEK